MKPHSRLKHIAKLEYGEALAQEVRADGTVPVFGSNGIVGRHDRPNMQAPSIVVGRKGSFGKVSWSRTEGFCIDTAYFIDSRHTAANLRWLFWALQTLGLDEHSEDTGVPGLSRERAYGTKLWLPSPSEQERIANFLDEKAVRIDTLIAEKERLCDVLVEQRLSIAERVIDGPGSGPLAKLGFYAELLPGYAFASDDFSKDSADVPLLRGVNVSPGRVRWDDIVYWPRPIDAPLHRFLLREGDVVLGMDRPWISTGARVAMIDAASEGALLLQRVCRLRGLGRIHQRFIFYALSSDRFRQSVEVEMTGVSVPHISPEQVLRFKIPVLSLAAQKQRCMLADEEISRIEQLVRYTTAMLDRLREYRSSLISAAVTGQLNIDAPVKELEPA